MFIEDHELNMKCWNILVWILIRKRGSSQEFLRRSARLTCCFEMSWCATDAIVCSTWTIFAEGNITYVLARSLLLFPTLEPWDCAVNVVHWVPPLPMIVDLVLEPNIYTATDGYVCSPCAVEILLSDHVCGVDVCVSRHWNDTVDCPWVNMCHRLTLCLREW